MACKLQAKASAPEKVRPEVRTEAGVDASRFPGSMAKSNTVLLGLPEESATASPLTVYKSLAILFVDHHGKAN